MTRGPVLVLTIAAAVAAGAAAAQQPNYAVNPSLSVAPPADNPVQQQIQQDYRSQLLGAQRDLMQANPSGVSPEQLRIGRELNGYNAGPLAPAPTAPAPSFAPPPAPAVPR